MQIFIVIIYLLEIESDVLTVEEVISILVVTVTSLQLGEQYFVMTVGLIT